MKLNPNFVVHSSGGETLLVPTAQAPFHGLGQGNATVGVILECLSRDVTEEEIVSTLASRFSGSREEMAEDVASVVSELRRIGAVIE